MALLLYPTRLKSFYTHLIPHVCLQSLLECMFPVAYKKGFPVIYNQEPHAAEARTKRLLAADYPSFWDTQDTWKYVKGSRITIRIWATDCSSS